MYHYLGSFQLYENSRVIRRFGYRCQSCIDNIRYDCKIELIEQSELLPNSSTKIQISFLLIQLVVLLVKTGNVYQLNEGSKPIGEVTILQDPWAKVEEWITEGEIRKAVVERIWWTTAEILMEGDIATVLTSKDMGLQE
jgi:predicted HNH restriction endonuclease